MSNLKAQLLGQRIREMEGLEGRVEDLAKVLNVDKSAAWIMVATADPRLADYEDYLDIYFRLREVRAINHLLESIEADEYMRRMTRRRRR